jgi:flavin-dependent dehydrogenase
MLIVALACVVVVVADCARFDSLKSRVTTEEHSAYVNESARDIPVIYDVDVVVVGGTSGGVAAAVAAAQRGATVFLAASRPYLGVDLCGTYRLWLEPDEEPSSPLGEKLFAEPASARRLRSAIPFTYEASEPSADMHKDTKSPSVLSDGKWHSASSQSVQYDGGVTLVADLEKKHELSKAHVMAYQRNNDFEVQSVIISVSDDKKQWKRITSVSNDKLGQGSFEEEPVDLCARIDQETRYVRFDVRKTDRVSRILLGEIIIESPQAEPASSDEYRVPPTPMQVKRVLDEALLEAGVQFLYGCYATDVLYDASGNPAGIVVANRSGRQAVKAKVIIDATPRAAVARMAGAKFKPYPAGPQTFKRIVVGGEVVEGPDVSARKMPTKVVVAGSPGYEAIEYTLTIPMEDASVGSFAEAEQVARDKTWHPRQVDDSDVLFQVPPDPVKAKAGLSGRWPGAQAASVDLFRPAGIERLYVVGGCAGVSRKAARQLLRPLEFMEVGSRIGGVAAVEAKMIAGFGSIHLADEPVSPASTGDIREDLTWQRPARRELGVVASQERAIPVLAEYDVVVVGGGTGGAPAGIAAARQGAETLVIEYLHGLGGVGTLGLIGKYCYGNRVGFTEEMDQGLGELGGPKEANSGKGQAWNNELKMQWYRRELRKAGADIWFAALGCGAVVEAGTVKGVAVATPQGRGVVLAKVVIDSTGNADIAAVAGAPCVYTNGHGIAVQGAGLPPHEPGARYTNTDWTFVDDTDIVDIWRAFVVAKKKYKGAYDLGQLVDTRERRHIVGDFVLSPLDTYLRRTFPDTVVLARSNFDTHGVTIHPMFMLKPPDRTVIDTYVPYRCLLPKDLEGILVTGLGISAHRDVMPVTRMQPDIQNQGYAAGVAAAMAVDAGTSVHDIDIRALQKHLVDKGNLSADVLTHEDSFPLPKDEIEKAVKTVVNDFDGLEIIFAQPEQALPLLQRAYAAADSEDAKLTYAHILGIMNDSTGARTLADAVKARNWDKGWKFTGMGQFGACMSELDSLIVALGRTRDREALVPIIEKVKELGPEHALSHHQAVAAALETLGERTAAKALAELLGKLGMTDYTRTNITEARQNVPASRTDTSTREYSLRELFLARALYRCGDSDGVGERILKEYARDLRGHYARHARSILNEGTPAPERGAK